MLSCTFCKQCFEPFNVPHYKQQQQKQQQELFSKVFVSLCMVKVLKELEKLC